MTTDHHDTDTPRPDATTEPPDSVTALGHTFPRGSIGYQLAEDYRARNLEVDPDGWPVNEPSAVKHRNSSNGTS